MTLREAFVSELCGRPVEIASKRIGTVEDIAVDASETFPPVVGLYVRVHRKLRYAPMSTVSAVAERVVTLSSPPVDPAEAQRSPNELLLNKELLDKQIVDVDGRKVVRVNDAKLAPAADSLRLIAVDVGLSGLLRRLGLRGMGQKLLERAPHPGIRQSLIAWNTVQPLHRDARSDVIRLHVPQDRIDRIHPVDLAAIIEDLNAADQASLVGSLDEETAAEAFEQLEVETQLSILEDLKPERAADIIENMSADDAADLLAEVDPEKQQELLSLMEPEEAQDVRELLTHGEETAGGLMTPEYLSIPSGLTVAQTFDRIRKAAEDAELIYYVYVLDEGERLLGVVAMRSLVTADPNTPIANIMSDDVVTVGLTTPREEVATTIARYDFLAVPVVDEDGRMRGIVTVDDALDVVLPEKLRKMLPRVGKSRTRAKA